MVKSRTYSRYSIDAAILLGKQIRLGRKQHQWSEAELAERAGISRSTVKKIEKGDMTCAVGLMFETAALVGVTLFSSDRVSFSRQSHHADDKIALLPKAIHKAKIEVDDDF